MRLYRPNATVRNERGGIIVWRVALIIFLALACLSYFVHSGLLDLIKAIAAGVAAITLLIEE
jgi:CHASE2 domain-containing sensor protein